MRSFGIRAAAATLAVLFREPSAMAQGEASHIRDRAPDPRRHTRVNPTVINQQRQPSTRCMMSVKTFVGGVILVPLVSMWLPLAASAQGTGAATIAGVVTDSSGAVLPGVTVEASSPCSSRRSEARSPTNAASTASSSSVPAPTP